MKEVIIILILCAWVQKKYEDNDVMNTTLILHEQRYNNLRNLYDLKCRENMNLRRNQDERK